MCFRFRENNLNSFVWSIRKDYKTKAAGNCDFVPALVSALRPFYISMCEVLVMALKRPLGFPLRHDPSVSQPLFYSCHFYREK